MTTMAINIVGSEIDANGSWADNRENGAIEKALADTIVGKKYLNRATKLAILASDRLPKPIAPDESNSDDVGLCIATFGAHFEHGINEFRELENSERPMISPMLGPNNAPNAIASQLSIYHKTMAFSLSFCDSGTAGLEALLFAITAIRQRRVKRVLVIGAESRPPDIERKIFGDGDPSYLDDSVAFTIMQDPIPPQQGKWSGVRYISHGRSYADPRDPALFRKAVYSCLSQAIGTEREGRDAIDVVFLGCSGQMADIELQVCDEIFGREGGFYYSTPDTRTKTKKSTSALVKLRYAMDLMNGKSLPETAAYLGTAAPPESLQNILINDFNQDGSMGCLVVSGMR